MSIQIGENKFYRTFTPFIDEKTKSAVENMVTEVYDMKETYEWLEGINEEDNTNDI